MSRLSSLVVAISPESLPRLEASRDLRELFARLQARRDADLMLHGGRLDQHPERNGSTRATALPVVRAEQLDLVNL